MNSQYVYLPEYYDALNSEVDYAAWARGLISNFKKYNGPDGALVLDLACGTGSVSLELAKEGYDVIGIDLSPEMLMRARDKSYDADADILWLCQDMRSFELYGTVSAIVCCLDSINYLLEESDLEKCFSLVRNYLDPGGIFIFDVITPYRFENILAKTDFIIENTDEDIYCGWHNYYDSEKKICQFDLSIFSGDGDGSYVRLDECQKERSYSLNTLKNMISISGLEFVSVSSSLEEEVLQDSDERWFFVVRKPI